MKVMISEKAPKKIKFKGNRLRRGDILSVNLSDKKLIGAVFCGDACGDGSRSSALIGDYGLDLPSTYLSFYEAENDEETQDIAQRSQEVKTKPVLFIDNDAKNRCECEGVGICTIEPFYVCSEDKQLKMKRYPIEKALRVFLYQHLRDIAFESDNPDVFCVKFNFEEKTLDIYKRDQLIKQERTIRKAITFLNSQGYNFPVK